MASMPLKNKNNKDLITLFKSSIIHTAALAGYPLAKFPEICTWKLRANTVLKV